MKKKSLHRFDAARSGDDSLLVVLSADQALELAFRLLQQLRVGRPTIELMLTGGQISQRPPSEAPPVVKPSRIRKKHSTLVAVGTIGPTHFAGGMRS